MIVMPNIDGKIWGIEHKLIDIVNALETTGKAVISLNAEGPCARELKLYDLLDDLCEKRNYLKSNITILTHNLLEHHDEYNIHISVPWHLLDTVKKFMQTNSFPSKNVDNLKHFGLFVHRSNWLRLWVGSTVFQNYKDQSLITFHYDASLDFHRDHLGVDELLRSCAKQVDLGPVVNLINQCPIILDEKFPVYPKLTPSHLKIAKVYDQFFVEIVCETYCQGTTFFPTEKLWRPIALKTPFIIQGPKNYYHNLRKIGFKTFGHWWDEGFTEDDYRHQPNEIFKVLNQLSKLTTSDLEALLIDMQSTLEHNYQLLMKLTPKDFVKAFQ